MILHASGLTLSAGHCIVITVYAVNLKCQTPSVSGTTARYANLYLNPFMTYVVSIAVYLGHTRINNICSCSKGGTSLLWSCVWFGIIHSYPHDHPRISIQEKTYIVNSIGNTHIQKTVGQKC